MQLHYKIVQVPTNCFRFRESRETLKKNTQSGFNAMVDMIEDLPWVVACYPAKVHVYAAVTKYRPKGSLSTKETG